MIHIDGSLGEGGGQVLRTSLTLSMVTGQDMRIENIRARRSHPGLRPQHLAAVEASKTISKAQVEGAFIGSQELIFRPGPIRTGRYKFDIRTAGSTSLVLQTIFIPLSLAGSASSVFITGGTHVRWSPCYHYLELQWLPYMHAIGFDSKLYMDKAGYYPQGGGRISATIRPCPDIQPIHINQRGALKSIRGISGVSNLPLSIADRQKRQAIRRLQNYSTDLSIKGVEMPSQFKGTVLLIRGEFEPRPGLSRAELEHPGRNIDPSGCFFGLGALGKPAESVADEAVDEFVAYINTEGFIDKYLADQLLVPLALASGPSQFKTSTVTQHLTTNASVVESFLPAKIDIEADLGSDGWVKVTPGG
jgi:RNA 3'-phosphate cyclase